MGGKVYRLVAFFWLTHKPRAISSKPTKSLVSGASFNTSVPISSAIGGIIKVTSVVLLAPAELINLNQTTNANAVLKVASMHSAAIDLMDGRDCSGQSATAANGESNKAPANNMPAADTVGARDENRFPYTLANP